MQQQKNTYRYSGVLGILCLLVAPMSAAETTSPTIAIKVLTPEMANRIVVAAIAACSGRGYKVSAAVVGRDGNLLAFLRHPLSGPHTVLTSQRKAYSAASLQVPTSQMSARGDLSFAPGIVLIVGGVPITAGSGFYGGVAVAGAEPQVDEQCARAGVAAVQETLEFAQ